MPNPKFTDNRSPDDRTLRNLVDDRLALFFECAMDARLDASLHEAEARLMVQFSQISVEALARDFEARLDKKQQDILLTCRTANPHDRDAV